MKAYEDECNRREELKAELRDRVNKRMNRE